MSADDTLTSGHSSDSTPTGASASATACACSKQSGDTEYDDEFRHVEKYNIISFSGVL